MRFQSDHEALDDLQHYISTNFDGNIWGRNGPEAVTKMILNMQKTKTSEKVLVYPKEQFYPIPYQEYWKIFNSNYKEEVLDKTKDSYGIHMWNAMNKLAKKVSSDPNSAFEALALKHCPVTTFNNFSRQ